MIYIAMHKLKAVIFDKDDTLMQDQIYSPEFDETYFFDDIITSCKILKNLDYRLFIISNQSGINKGKFEEATLVRNYISLNFKLKKDYGFSFDGFFYCPHNPNENCSCRKPLIGLYTRLQAYFQINTDKSFYIGDRLSDIYFAMNCGLNSITIHRNNYIYKDNKVYSDLPQIEIMEEEGKTNIFNSLIEFVNILNLGNNFNLNKFKENI